MASKYGAEFDAICRWARRELPIDKGFVVRTVKSLRDEDGVLLDGIMVDPDKGPYRISIRQGMSLALAIDTLLHEISHCLDTQYNGFPDRADHHRRSWGESYAAVYRKFLEWENKRCKE